MDTSSIVPLLAHLLAAYAILAAPWLGRFWYRKAQKRIQAGDPRAKIRLYRQVVTEQTMTTFAICGLWVFGGIPRKSLGICAPRSWIVTTVLATLLVGLLLRSALKLRPKAQRVREKLGNHLGTLLPDSLEELRWFAVLSVGAGISEELVFRGFLFYYLNLHIPHINNLEKALLTSLFFGMGHLYQGWPSVPKTGIASLILAGLYLLTGSLLLPMVVHAMNDMQVPLIFWPGATRGAVLEAGT